MSIVRHPSHPTSHQLAICLTNKLSDKKLCIFWISYLPDNNVIRYLILPTQKTLFSDIPFVRQELCKIYFEKLTHTLISIVLSLSEVKVHTHCNPCNCEIQFSGNFDSHTVGNEILGFRTLAVFSF